MYIETSRRFKGKRLLDRKQYVSKEHELILNNKLPKIVVSKNLKLLEETLKRKS